MSVRILIGSALDVLRTLPNESVQVCVTSPPYWALRAYGTDPQVWGGDDDHTHAWGKLERAPWANAVPGPNAGGKNAGLRITSKTAGTRCDCGAWRGELGQEPTPELFIEHMVMIFEEVRRVLRPDGLVFCNIGDSYAGSGKGPNGHNGIGDQGQRQGFVGTKREPNSQLADRPVNGYQKPVGGVAGIPAKNLLLIPQRFAIAMQDAGWYVRSCIVWAKTSAMPESVKDRPTSAWEPIWMFAKSRTYYWDQEAVRQPISHGWTPGKNGQRAFSDGFREATGDIHRGFKTGPTPDGANLRNYWPVNQPMMRLRSDLTPDQRAYVLRRLAGGTGEVDRG